MAQFTFSNFVNTTLASAITNSATTITLSSSAGLPTTVSTQFPFAIVLNDAATRSVYEVVYATAISGATLTVLRGQEGTLAQSWLTGDYAYSGVTAGQMSSQGGFINPMTTAGDIIVGVFNGAPARLGIGTSGYVLTAGSGALSWQAAQVPPSGVTSFNTRSGAVTLNSADVTGALGYTPYSQAGGTIIGAVGIDSTLVVAGTTNLQATLAVTGNASLGGALTSVLGNFVVYGTTTTQASDRRIKDAIRPIRNALSVVEHSLAGVEFNFKSGEHAAGFIAQDVETGLPHLVRQSEHDGIQDFRTLDYHQAIPYLAAAITELHELVKEQAHEIRMLRASK